MIKVIQNGQFTDDFLNRLDHFTVPIKGNSFEFYTSKDGKRHLLLLPSYVTIYTNKYRSATRRGFGFVIPYLIVSFITENDFIRRVSVADEIQKMVDYLNKHKRMYNIERGLLISAYNTTHKQKGYTYSVILYKKGMTVNSGLFRDIKDKDVSDEEVNKLMQSIGKSVAHMTIKTYEGLFSIVSNLSKSSYKTVVV
jgi:hypothetical protein